MEEFQVLLFQKRIIVCPGSTEEKTRYIVIFLKHGHSLFIIFPENLGEKGSVLKNLHAEIKQLYPSYLSTAMVVPPPLSHRDPAREEVRRVSTG